MVNMAKIRDVSDKYGITARTLRYYEDMGLISSARSDDYAYRMYDEAAVRRLEQILILRKLNISIRDIQRVFAAPDSEAVLDVLGEKVKNIDDEVALLHELKEIVLGFIREIERMDFGSNSDIKSLYDKAKEIETNLTNVGYIGKPGNVGRLFDVAEKLEKKADIRIVELPACRMATSGVSRDDDHKQFNEMWMKLHERRKDRFFPRDFMWYDKEQRGTVWWYAVEEWVTEADTDGFGFVDFEGGMYATAIVADFDYNEALRAYNGVKDWITRHVNFEMDERPEHEALFHASSSAVSQSLGYNQVEYYFPIRVK